MNTQQPTTQQPAPVVTFRTLLPALPVGDTRELWGEAALVAWAEAHFVREGIVQ
jgi:hypothetical protein